MSGRATASDFNTQIYEQACAWFIDMRAGDVDLLGRQRFDAWVRKSPEHLRAYLEISEIWDDSRLVDPQRTRDREDLLVHARGGAEIVSLASVVPPSGVDIGDKVTAVDHTRSRRTFPRQHWISAAAAFVAVAAGLAAFVTYEQVYTPTYSTDIGEGRAVTLVDGSRIELNSRTRVSVRFTDRARDVELLQGQALFRVAKNQQRPFIVHSGALTVRAVGTEFDVDRKRSATTVTVLEGRVAVTDLPEPELQNLRVPDLNNVRLPVFVDAGEQVMANSHRPLQATRANVSAATAWTRGTLVFAGTRLADVVEEFNRHNQRQLIVHDRSLDDMEISGVYASTDPALLLRFLREQPSVQVEETDTAILISAK